MSTKQSLPATSRSEITSPFLDEQFLAFEAEKGPRPGGAGVTFESPFQNPSMQHEERTETFESIETENLDYEIDEEMNEENNDERSALAPEVDEEEIDEADTEEHLAMAEEHEEDETFESDVVEESLTPAARPAANAIDADAAEPIFSARVRTPEGPLLDAALLHRSRGWNEATHPKLSGIPLAELRERLQRYLDRPGLDDLMRQANATASGSYPTDDATIVTLLAHQFQRKTCRTPTVGGVTRKATMDGRVAEDTLDALGFVYHSGKEINAADRPNKAANAVLRKIATSVLATAEPGLTAKTWWSYMVCPPWLGMPIKQGIHLVLLKRLRRAQQALMDLPAYADLSPAELGQVLALEEEHKGARPYNTDVSMHVFGLAIDIGYTRNPWLRNTATVAEITLRAARLVEPSGARQGITGSLLHDLAMAHRDTAKIHKILADWSRVLGEYFALATNAKELERLLPTANIIHPGAGWFKAGESLAEAARRWPGIIRKDFDAFAAALARGGNKGAVRHGFMDLARDLVIALREEACLAWGAVDFGPRASGDVMHFDCRVDGIGRMIGQTAERAYIPTAGHPCLSAVKNETVESEFEQTDRRVAPAMPVRRTREISGGHALSFTSRAIPEYANASGKAKRTASWVYVPDAAWKQQSIDLVVFFHGDPGPCKATFDPDPKNDGGKFGLAEQISRSGRRVAVAVPVIHWIPRKSANILGKWTAANLNAFVEEVLESIGQESDVTPAVGRLILAGHSHAFAIFTPLACEFDHEVPATKTGALAKLDQVWSLDSTYSQWHVRALEVWAHKLATARLIAVLSKGGTPLAQWKSYYDTQGYCPKGFNPPQNLSLCAVDDKHCAIPAQFVGRLLTIPRNAPVSCGS